MSEVRSVKVACCPRERTVVEKRLVVPAITDDLHGGAAYRIRFVCENCGARSPWYWEGDRRPEPAVHLDNDLEEPNKGENK